MEDSSLAYSRPARVIVLIFSIAALSFWAEVSSVSVSVLLNYPLRRAGENNQYPPLHTFQFFWSCAWVLTKALLQTSHVWLLALVVTIAGLCFGLNVHSHLARTTIVITALLGPIIVAAIYWIFIVY
jgi:hypothetical protein